MDARNIPPFGVPVVVQELEVASEWMHKSINVTGRLDQHDISNCQAKLVAPKTQAFILVDTTLVEPFDAKIGSLFQFIGEVVSLNKELQNSVVLQARVVRCCDGLDLVLYEQALKSQRDFLENRPNR